MVEHRALSRSGAEQKFKGGLADSSEIVVQYHTTTHLLLAALRELVGDHVHQPEVTSLESGCGSTSHTQKKWNEKCLTRLKSGSIRAIKNGGLVTTDIMSKDIAQADKTIEASFWDQVPRRS